MSRLRGALVPVTPLQQNCTLLWDEDTKVSWVIDPGGDVVRILEAIDKLELQAERILLTHGHVDHAGGAARLRDALPNCVVEGPHSHDAFLLDDLEMQGRRLGIEDAKNVRPDRFLAEGDTLQLEGHCFQVLECPGHTPGHIVFINHDNRLALVGDVLFQGSVGRTDFPYGNSMQLLWSIRKKLLPLPDEMQFICGHGPASTIGAERHTNIYVHEAMRLQPD